MAWSHDGFFQELEEEISFGPSNIKKPVLPHTPPLQSAPRKPIHTTPRTPARSTSPRQEVVHGVRETPQRFSKAVPERKSTPRPQIESGGRMRPDHIKEARDQMSTSGVVVILFVVDANTRTLVRPIKLETRWFAGLDEVREMHRLIIKAVRQLYEETIADIPDIEDKDLIKIIKKDLGAIIVSRFRRDPMIIPVMVSL